MHRLLRKHLTEATGQSEFIIAVNIDIRGFSAFSKEEESPAVAAYIKKVYIKLLDDYFPQATFFKPTGDGLLLTITYEESTLQQRVQEVIDTCFRVIADFANFTANDPMINFAVPQRVGIGLCRGTACRLASRGKTLDFSGRVLNLASRLMDFARPTGIVFDYEFDISLLTEEKASTFELDQVYIKGIAERIPLKIYYSKEYTTISPLNKQPIDQTRWGKIRHDASLKQIKASSRFSIELTSKPVDGSQIRIKVTHPTVIKGKKQSDLVTFFDITNFEYVMDAEVPRLTIDFATLASRLIESGVKDNWPVTLDITYPEL